MSELLTYPFKICPYCKGFVTQCGQGVLGLALQDELPEQLVTEYLQWPELSKMN